MGDRAPLKGEKSREDKWGPPFHEMAAPWPLGIGGTKTDGESLTRP